MGPGQYSILPRTRLSWEISKLSKEPGGGGGGGGGAPTAPPVPLPGSGESGGDGCVAGGVEAAKADGDARGKNALMFTVTVAAGWGADGVVRDAVATPVYAAMACVSRWRAGDAAAAAVCMTAAADADPNVGANAAAVAVAAAVAALAADVR